MMRRTPMLHHQWLLKLQVALTKKVRRVPVLLDSDVAPPVAPEAPGGAYQKSEKSAGVIGLMDMMVREIETDMKDSAYEEKTSQSDYAKLMAESQ